MITKDITKTIQEIDANKLLVTEIQALINSDAISKEELLKSVIDFSMTEILDYFDPNKDGILTQDEFELFIRNTFRLMREEREFYTLFFGLIICNDNFPLLLIYIPYLLFHFLSGLSNQLNLVFLQLVVQYLFPFQLYQILNF